MSAAFKQDELQLKIQQLQAEYQSRIQSAAQSSDFSEMQRLGLEMATEMQKLIAASVQLATAQATTTPTPTGPIYQSDLTEMALDDYVYAGEQKHFLAIMMDPFLQPLINSMQDTMAFKRVDASLAKTALKLDLRFSPTLKYAVERCQQVLKLKAKMDVYVMASPEMNAFCMASEEGTIKIGVTSALLEKFNPSEMAFVIGHEIGHALFKHTSIPTSQILSSGVEGLTPLHVMRLLAWKRSAEITADRVGLLCGDSFEKSARSLFKVSYGFDVHEDEALHQYINDFRDTEKLMRENISPDDFLSTHPFGPIRLTALDAFAKSSVFSNHVGKPTSELDRPALEKRVDQIVSVFESSYLDNPEGLQKDMSDFIFLGGVMIAACDGEVSRSEVAALSELIKRPIDGNELNVLLAAGPEKAGLELEKVAKTIYATVYPRQRLMLIRDLCTVAMADGKIMQAEFETLVKIAALLFVTPKFIEDVLEGAVHGLD